MKFSAGLDLGQVNDYSALVVAEREGAGRHRTYTVRLARRWRGLQYTALAGEVGQILRRSPLEGQVTLKVDATGVGRAVLNILEQAHGDGILPCWPEPITFTAGQEAGPATLPKRDAVARVEVLIGSGRLRFAWHLLLARQIKDELREFRAKVSGSGHVSFEASGSGHDDLVTALSLAVHEGSNEQLESLAAAYGALEDPEEEQQRLRGWTVPFRSFRLNREALEEEEYREETRERGWARLDRDFPQLPRSVPIADMGGRFFTRRGRGPAPQGFVPPLGGDE